MEAILAWHRANCCADRFRFLDLRRFRPCDRERRRNFLRLERSAFGPRTTRPVDIVAKALIPKSTPTTLASRLRDGRVDRTTRKLTYQRSATRATVADVMRIRDDVIPKANVEASSWMRMGPSFGN